MHAAATCKASGVLVHKLLIDLVDKIHKLRDWYQTYQYEKDHPDEDDFESAWDIYFADLSTGYTW